MLKRKYIISVIALSLTCVIGFKFYASYQAQKKVYKLVSDLAPFSYIEYESVNVGFFSTRVNIKNVTISSRLSNEKTKIDKIVLGNFENFKGEPSPTYLSITGINFSSKSTSPMQGRLGELGYQDLKFDVLIDYNYDEDDSTLDINELSIGSPDMGQLSLSASATDINLTPQSMLPIQSMYAQTKIEKFYLEYKDLSLVSRIYKLEAATKNESVDQYKSFLINIISEYMKDNEDKFISDTASPIKKFINDPNRISIKIAPKSPVSIDRIMHTPDTKELIRLLNVEVQS